MTISVRHALGILYLACAMLCFVAAWQSLQIHELKVKVMLLESQVCDEEPQQLQARR